MKNCSQAGSGLGRVGPPKAGIHVFCRFRRVSAPLQLQCPRPELPLRTHLLGQALYILPSPSRRLDLLPHGTLGPCRG